MEGIVEKSLELSQCVDMRNQLTIIEESLQAHSAFIHSLLDVLKHGKSVKANKQTLNTKLNEVIQRRGLRCA